MQFPPQFEPSEFWSWFASQLSVRFVWIGGKAPKARVMAVMQRRKDRRIGVKLSLEDLLPAWTLLVLNTVHLDVTSRTLRDCRLDAFERLDAFGRLDRLGTGNRE